MCIFYTWLLNFERSLSTNLLKPSHSLGSACLGSVLGAAGTSRRGEGVSRGRVGLHSPGSHPAESPWAGRVPPSKPQFLPGSLLQTPTLTGAGTCSLFASWGIGWAGQTGDPEGCSVLSGSLNLVHMAINCPFSQLCKLPSRVCPIRKYLIKKHKLLPRPQEVNEQSLEHTIHTEKIEDSKQMVGSIEAA